MSAVVRTTFLVCGHTPPRLRACRSYVLVTSKQRCKLQVSILATAFVATAARLGVLTTRGVGVARPACIVGTPMLQWEKPTHPSFLRVESCPQYFR